LQEGWPVTFWSINTHLPEEDRVDLYPKYKLLNHITMSEIALARLMFENQNKRILKDVEPAEKQALQSKMHSYKNKMGFNNQTLKSKGEFIKEVVADLSKSRNIRKKLDLSLEDRNYAEQWFQPYRYLAPTKQACYWL
jgi:hypothetical protein